MNSRQSINGRGYYSCCVSVLVRTDHGCLKVLLLTEVTTLDVFEATQILFNEAGCVR